MSYTLATAAEVAGKTKPTIWRAVKSGKISATRLDDGSFRIEPCELDRYLAATRETPPAETAMRSGTGSGYADMDAKALQEAITLRLTVGHLETLLATERERAAELRQEREHWREQAQRLAITHERPVVGAPAREEQGDRNGFLARLLGSVRG
jgi:excisionase family DNA binding protein